VVYLRETTMPRDKDLKRLVRARMKKTGEAYTAARTQILRKPRRKTARATSRAAVTPAAPPSPTPSPAEYAALAGMSDDAVKAKTGCTWERWVYALDRHGAAEMSHREIAAIVSEKYKVGDWWCQMVTVGYERIKGIRAKGQRRNGTYEASKSRTFDVPVATLYDSWADAAIRRRWLDTADVKVRGATSKKSMRLGWPDGTLVTLWFTAKGSERSSVALAHAKLPDRDTVTRLKQFWSERLDALDKVLSKQS
jgi:hypothetical protein